MLRVHTDAQSSHRLSCLNNSHSTAPTGMSSSAVEEAEGQSESRCDTMWVQALPSLPGYLGSWRRERATLSSPCRWLSAGPTATHHCVTVLLDLQIKTVEAQRGSTCLELGNSRTERLGLDFTGVFWFPRPSPAPGHGTPRSRGAHGSLPPCHLSWVRRSCLGSRQLLPVRTVVPSPGGSWARRQRR